MNGVCEFVVLCELGANFHTRLPMRMYVSRVGFGVKPRYFVQTTLLTTTLTHDHVLITASRLQSRPGN